MAWRLINLLSLNYLSLLDTDGGDGARGALRDLLEPLAAWRRAGVQRQIEALAEGQRAAPSCAATRCAGPIAFGRGMEVELTVDELGFEGGSAFLFGARAAPVTSRATCR